MGRVVAPRLLVVAALFVLAAAPPGAAPVQLVLQPPVSIASVAPGVWLVDFGRVAFGNLRVVPPPGASATVTLHFGESLEGGRDGRARQR